MLAIASPGETEVAGFPLVFTPEATIKPVGEGFTEVALGAELTNAQVGNVFAKPSIAGTYEFLMTA